MKIIHCNTTGYSLELVEDIDYFELQDILQLRPQGRTSTGSTVKTRQF